MKLNMIEKEEALKLWPKEWDSTKIDIIFNTKDLLVYAKRMHDMYQEFIEKEKENDH